VELAPLSVPLVDTLAECSLSSNVVLSIELKKSTPRLVVPCTELPGQNAGVYFLIMWVGEKTDVTVEVLHPEEIHDSAYVVTASPRTTLRQA